MLVRVQLPNYNNNNTSDYCCDGDDDDDDDDDDHGGGISFAILRGNTTAIVWKAHDCHNIRER